MRKIAAIGVGLAVATFGLTAMAEEPAPAAAASSGGGMTISAAALAGFGLQNLEFGTEKVNPWGLGFGVRAGVNLSGPIYVGGTFVYHLGKKIDLGANSSVQVGMQYYGAEVGYDLAAGPATIRPYLGLGFASAHGETCFSGICGSSSSDSKLYIAPGAAFLFGDKIFGGADVRYVMVTGDGVATTSGNSKLAAPAVFGTVGMKF